MIKFFIISSFLPSQILSLICGPNSYYSNECWETCDQPTCDFNHFGLEKNCNNCSGCVCEYGYVWNKLDNLCVLPSDCPNFIPCSTNETLKYCKGCVSWQDSCKDYGVVYQIACLNGCYMGCYCSSGYVFDDSVGKCVLPEDCSCDSDEYYYVCKKPWPRCVSECTKKGKAYQ